jgi:hypothetical protein
MSDPGEPPCSPHGLFPPWRNFFTPDEPKTLEKEQIEFMKNSFCGFSE